jgi:hypothetical protein
LNPGRHQLIALHERAILVACWTGLARLTEDLFDLCP